MLHLIINHIFPQSPMCTEEINHLPNILEEVDITPYLVFKKDNEDGPEVKGGHIDALIVHASRVQKDKGRLKYVFFSFILINILFLLLKLLVRHL